MVWARVHGHLEEGPCAWCGAPLYSGDSILWLDDGFMGGCCSSDCARRQLEKKLRRAVDGESMRTVQA